MAASIPGDLSRSKSCETHRSSARAGYCSAYGAAAKPPNSWIASGAVAPVMGTPRVCQCGDTTTIAVSSGRHRADAREVRVQQARLDREHGRTMGKKQGGARVK